MTKHTSKSAALSALPAKPRSEAETAAILGLTPIDFRLLSQVTDAMWFHADTSQERKLEIMASAMALTKDINPADPVERMLAAQMVATHNSAMECLRRAAYDGQTFVGRDMNLKNAAKLLAIYTRQMDALNNHRGKGQQKVTVEHVHIESGAQAVVGNIGTGSQPALSHSKSRPAPRMITNALGTALDLKVEAPAPIKRRLKKAG